jgi:peptidoglycan-N-acetylmuramic acid deacetylase
VEILSKRMPILALVIVLLAAVIPGCNESRYNKSLSDLGGVYSSRWSDMNLSIEVSGRLSEDYKSNAGYISPEEIVCSTIEGDYSNVLLRWGISRKPDGGIPNADPGAPALLKKYGGVYIGDTNKKEIYLTFDEGYENGYTGKILDVLKDNKVHAVFFITGPYLKDHQDLVRRMVEEGHTVGNHTIHHPSLPSLSEKEMEEELLGLERVFKDKFSQNMKFLRPPKGEYSEKTLALSQKLGYTNMFWSFAYDDWYRDKVRGADYAYNIVMRNLHNGAVLLLHAVSKDNADALDMIIKGARERVYTIGNINDITAGKTNLE